MTREEYQAFVRELAAAEEAEVHGFEDKNVFEGCMPVEVMARRGEDTLRYGPRSPSVCGTRQRAASPMLSFSSGATMRPETSTISSGSRRTCVFRSRSACSP